jgi:hypothetical protein
MKLVLIVCLMLTGCGINENFDKINANMVNLNTKIVSMNGNIETMKNSTSSMAVSIGAMSDSLTSTKNSIKAQSLMLAQNEMLKPENTKYISLGGGSFIPMLPSAQAFANMLTPDELAGIAYIYISEINLAQTDSPLTPKQQEEYDLGKYIKLTALGLIAALTPQSTVDGMIKQQIIDGGSYTDAAYGVLVLRNIITRDILLEQLVGNGSVKLNASQQKLADSYRKILRDTQQYKFFDKLVLKLYGFYNKELNQVLKVEKVNNGEKTYD